MKKLIALALFVALALPMAALAAEGSVYADVLSAYVYNGLVGNDEAVFQPGLDVAGPLGLEFNLWSSMNLTDADSAWYPDSAGEWGELNLGATWALPWEGPVSLAVGGLYYVFPQDSSEVDEDGAVSKAPADGGYEVFVRAAADGILLAPTLTVYHGMANSDDWIAKLSISHSISISDALSLDLGATVGYAGEYYIANDYGSDTGTAFTHVQFDAGLNFALSDALSVGVKGAYSSILDSDVRDDIQAEGYYPEVDIFFGGVTASYSF